MMIEMPPIPDFLRRPPPAPEERKRLRRKYSREARRRIKNPPPARRGRSAFDLPKTMDEAAWKILREREAAKEAKKKARLAALKALKALKSERRNDRVQAAPGRLNRGRHQAVETGS